MPGFSDTVENAVLDLMYRGVAFTPPPGILVALHSADPGENGTDNELTDANYSRQTVTFAAASGGSIANSSVVEFGGLTGFAGPVTIHSISYRRSDDGTCISTSTLASPRSLEAGDTYKWSAGNLTATLS